MVKVCIIALGVLVACTAAKPFDEILPVAKDLLSKSGNIIGIEADVHGKVAGHEVGADAAAGIGEQGIGGHGAGAADIFGQKAGTHGDVLGGCPGEHHEHHDHGHHDHGHHDHGHHDHGHHDHGHHDDGHHDDGHHDHGHHDHGHQDHGHQDHGHHDDGHRDQGHQEHHDSSQHGSETHDGNDHGQLIGH